MADQNLKCNFVVCIRHVSRPNYLVLVSHCTFSSVLLAQISYLMNASMDYAARLDIFPIWPTDLAIAP